jgi:hypothetical protein
MNFNYEVTQLAFEIYGKLTKEKQTVLQSSVKSSTAQRSIDLLFSQKYGGHNPLSVRSLIALLSFPDKNTCNAIKNLFNIYEDLKPVQLDSFNTLLNRMDGQQIGEAIGIIAQQHITGKLSPAVRILLTKYLLSLQIEQEKGYALAQIGLIHYVAEITNWPQREQLAIRLKTLAKNKETVDAALRWILENQEICGFDKAFLEGFSRFLILLHNEPNN